MIHQYLNHQAPDQPLFYVQITKYVLKYSGDQIVDVNLRVVTYYQEVEPDDNGEDPKQRIFLPDKGRGVIDLMSGKIN